jgi:hypothetical protein
MNNPGSNPSNFDIALIQRRLAIINDRCNNAIHEIHQRGALRVPVEPAFGSADELVKLIAIVCLLKKYATAAAMQQGQAMDLGVWAGWFDQFDRDCHIMPDGKAS